VAPWDVGQAAKDIKDGFAFVWRQGGDENQALHFIRGRPPDDGACIGVAHNHHVARGSLYGLVERREIVRTGGQGKGRRNRRDALCLQALDDFGPTRSIGPSPVGKHYRDIVCRHAIFSI